MEQTTAAPQKDWNTIGLNCWKQSHDAFIFEAKVMLEQYDRTRTIPMQPFSRLFKRVQCHSVSEERSIFRRLPYKIQCELIRQHMNTETMYDMSFPNKAKWLRSLIAHISLEEDIVWQHLNKQEAHHK